MADDARERQRKRFGEAVERKRERSRRRSRARGDGRGRPDREPTGVHGDQESLYDRERPQDTTGPRDKSSGKRKKTADNWNQ